MAEVVYNKAQRLTFDSSSPNGILLFRETSALLCVFGSRALTHEPPPSGDLYEHKYKGIGIALLTLQRALSGNYVNFGVFALYGDKALDDVLSIAIQLCLYMQLGEMLSFPKLAKTYFTLIEILMRNHTATMVKLDTIVLAHIATTLTVRAAGARALALGAAARPPSTARPQHAARVAPRTPLHYGAVRSPACPPARPSVRPPCRRASSRTTCPSRRSARRRLKILPCTTSRTRPRASAPRLAAC